MENTNEEIVEEVEEPLDLPEVDEGEEDTTDYKAKAKELSEKAIKQRERTKALKQELAATKKAVELALGTQKPPVQKTTGELDETQLDYLDLKGITESEDIDVIQRIMAKTGQTVRQALKDDYVQAKLAELKAARDVKDATPSSTRRTGQGPVDGLELAIAKFEQTGVLPTDFALRSAVINAKVEKENTNKPAWH